MKTIAYLRVSTDQQDLDNQRLEIEEYCKKQKLDINEWIQVEISSRKNQTDRKICELLASLKRGDRLIVSELSRLSRSIKGTHEIMDKLARKRIEVHVIKQNLVTHGMGDMTTKVLINAFAMCAEIERDLISARTKNGLALAKKRGVKLGNPQIHKLVKNKKRNADKFAETLRPIITGFVAQNMTQRAIAGALNQAGIRSRKDCEWSLIMVQNLLKRLNLKTKHTRK